MIGEKFLRSKRDIVFGDLTKTDNIVHRPAGVFFGRLLYVNKAKGAARLCRSALATASYGGFCMQNERAGSPRRRRSIGRLRSATASVCKRKGRLARLAAKHRSAAFLGGLCTPGDQAARIHSDGAKACPASLARLYSPGAFDYHRKGRGRRGAKLFPIASCRERTFVFRTQEAFCALP